MQKTFRICAISITFVCLILADGFRRLPASATETVASKPIKIGVDIRLGYQQCMDAWVPVAEHLTKSIPNNRFVIVPLASREDIERSLKKNKVDFLVLDPVMAILANDLYAATPMITMVETNSETASPNPTKFISGVLIRRADRNDLADIQDIRGKRLSAIKPWSLSGWIAQWELLQSLGIDPQNDLKQVVFEGTNEQAVKNVLSGSADIAAVDSDMLIHLIRNKQVSESSLFFFNREGHAVPVVVSKTVSSTEIYPGYALSKSEAISDELAERVIDVLMKQPVDISVDGVPYEVSWTVASDYSTVRRLLRTLMGSDYAESSGYPLPKSAPTWLLQIAIILSELAVLIVAIVIIQARSNNRISFYKKLYEDMRCELLEARAERQRFNSILSLAGCGIDIVDEKNQIVYADTGLEREYGDWHGRKCHDYFCGSDKPCTNCRRPRPSDEQGQVVLDIDGSQPIPHDDIHAKVHYISGKSTRMIGIPFRDEGGRWLYARIHFPLEAFATINHA